VQKQGCLGHRSKIKYLNTTFSISKIKRFSKNIKNIDELRYQIIQLSPAETNEIAKMLSALCYFTKGGHHPEKIDTLQKKIIRFYPKNHRSQKNMVQVVFYRLLLFLTLL
jgi:hypothetical protein